jgi:predicted amidohydrolase YtcJ
MVNSILFRSARIFDGETPNLRVGLEVLVADGVIRRVSESPIAVTEDIEVVDCGGRVLMPGLIDAHVHVYAYGLNMTLWFRRRSLTFPTSRRSFCTPASTAVSPQFAMSAAQMLAWHQLSEMA